MDTSKSTSLIGLILLSISSVLMVGCGGIEIMEPIQDSVHIEPPGVILDFGDNSAGSASAFINDINVSKFLTYSGNRGFISAEDAKRFLRDGKNQLRISAPSKATTDFYYDGAGPIVSFTKVDDSGQSLRVEGRVRDISEVTSLRIGGQNISYSSTGLFSATISDSNFIDVQATDALNKTSNTRYARPQSNVNNGFSVRLEQHVFDLLIEDVVTQIHEEGVEDFLISMNPVYNKDVNGNRVIIDVTAASLDLPEWNFNFMNSNGLVDASGMIPNYEIQFKVTVDPSSGSNYTRTGTFTVGRVDYDGEAKLTTNNGAVVLNMQNVNVSLNDLETNYNNFPGWLQSVATGFFNQFTKIAVTTRVDSLYKEHSERLINVIPPNLLISKQGKGILPNVTTASLSSPSSGLNISLRTSPEAKPKKLDSIGYAYRNISAIPDINTFAQDSNRPTVTALLSINEINKAMSAAYESQILDIITENSQLGTNKADKYRSHVSITNPPTIELSSAPNELARIKSNNIKLIVSVRKAETNSYERVFTSEFDMEASANFTVTPDSKVVIGLTGTPIIDVFNTETVDSSLSTSAIESNIKSTLKTAVPIIAKSLAPMIPLPQFEGYELDGEIWVADDKNEYLAVGAEMIRLR